MVALLLRRCLRADLLVGLILIALGTVLGSGFVLAQEITGLAKDFTLKQTTGENVRLAEQKGKVILINFWASWCDSCFEAFPLLNAIYEKYKSQAFLVLGVNVDISVEMINRGLKIPLVNFPILMDPSKGVAQLYEVKDMPTTYIIDRSGRLRFVYKGFKGNMAQQFDQAINQLIQE